MVKNWMILIFAELILILMKFALYNVQNNDNVNLHSNNLSLWELSVNKPVSSKNAFVITEPDLHVHRLWWFGTFGIKWSTSFTVHLHA